MGHCVSCLLIREGALSGPREPLASIAHLCLPLALHIIPLFVP